METNKDMTLNVALCEGRHEIPQATDGTLFQAVIDDPTDLKRLERKAFGSLWRKAIEHNLLEEYKLYNDPERRESELRFKSGIQVNLYVTGLTVALIAALNVCRREKLHVTLYHYDRKSGEYYPQEVI